MFCTKCGAKNEDNAKFCTSCGAEFEEVRQDDEIEENAIDEVTVREEYNEADTVEESIGEETVTEKPKGKKGVLLAIAGVAAVVIAAVVMFAVFGGKGAAGGVLVYEKDGDTYIANSKKGEATKIENVSNYGYYTVKLSEDGKTLYYMTDDDTLVCAPLSKPSETTEIKKNVNKFLMFEKSLFIGTDKGLYCSRDAKGEVYKVCGNYDDLYYDKGIKNFVWTDDGKLYVKKNEKDAEKVKIAKDVSEIVLESDYYKSLNDRCVDADAVYYIGDDGTLYVGNSEKTTPVAEDVEEAVLIDGVVVFARYDGGEYSVYTYDGKKEKTLAEDCESVELGGYDYNRYFVNSDGEKCLLTPTGYVVMPEDTEKLSATEDYKSVYATVDGKFCVYKIDGNKLKNKKEICECAWWRDLGDGHALIAVDGSGENGYEMRYFDGSKAYKLAEDIDYYATILNNGDEFLYVTCDGQLVRQTAGKERKVLAKGVESVRASSDFETIYYGTEEDDSYCFDIYKVGEKEPVAKNVKGFRIIDK